MSDWQSDLRKLAHDVRIEFFSVDDIRQEAHARATMAVLQAFGDTAGGLVYTEPCVRDRTGKPPDILIAHPRLGILVIEVKGWPIEKLHRITGGQVFVAEGGFNKPRNVFRQASEAMYQIKDAVRRTLRRDLGREDDRLMPRFNFMVAFPNIREHDWRLRGYENCLEIGHMLFHEQLQNPNMFKERIEKAVCAGERQGTQVEMLTPEQLILLRMALGDSAVINERRDVRLEIPELSIGNEIDEFVILDKNLSREQQELSRANFEGHSQLIRGVAGSGKSVVLANCVACFVNRKLKESRDALALNRRPRVAVVCFNRSFVSFLRKKISDSFQDQTFQDPPDGIIDVRHLNGLLFSMSDSPVNPHKGPLHYQPFSEEIDPNPSPAIAANYLNQLELLAQSDSIIYDSMLFDAIYVDEGQDFHPEEFRLLMKLLRPHPETNKKNIVIFYDDAQNLYGRPRPNWSQVGVDVVGGGHSRVMKECFRNSRQIVEFAFNVLLGAKAAPEVRVQTREYSDVAYLRSAGLVEELEDRWRVRFAERLYRPPEVRLFQSRDQEINWLCEEIDRLISEQCVRPKDILVVFDRSTDFNHLDSLIASRTKTIQGFVKPFRSNLDKDSYIFRDDHLTISTIKGAKGYDAPVVFLVGTDQLKSDREGRASFYVGATRAKMLLFVSGLNDELSLAQEAYQVQQMLFSPTYV